MKIFFGLLAAVVGLGCYNPSISTSLHCGPSSGKRCPDGYGCQGDICVKGAAPTGSGGTTVGSGGSGASTGGSTGTGGTSPIDGGPDVVVKPRTRGQSCDVVDNCDKTMNLVCMEDCTGRRCYQFCDKDIDCPQSSCTRQGPTGAAQKVCEVDFAMCNPVDSRSGCANPTNQPCYLLMSAASQAGADRAVCDCSQGSARRDESCSDSRECAPGLLCLPPDGRPGAGTCQRACDPMAASSVCTAGTCHAYGARWGYCYL
jgi:hypothetical protein